MAKYKGSVELIAGITQKNKEAGNNFALVDAADVQVDDSGKRLNERLDELAAGIGTGNGAPVELSNYYNRTEAEEKFAKKTDVEGFAKTSDLESLSSALGTLSDDYEYLNSRHASTAAKLQIAENTVADHETRLHNLEKVQGAGGQEFDLSNYYTKDETDALYASREEIDYLLAGGADLTQYAKIETVEDLDARISELEALGGVTFDTAEFEDLSTDDKTIIGAINEIATDAYLSFSKATKNEATIDNIKGGSVEVGRAKAATNDAVGRAIHETYATRDELDAAVSGGADLTQYTKTADFLNGTVEVQRAQRATYDAEGNLIHGTYATHTDVLAKYEEFQSHASTTAQRVMDAEDEIANQAERIENHEERIGAIEKKATWLHQCKAQLRYQVNLNKQIIADFITLPSAKQIQLRDGMCIHDYLLSGKALFVSGYIATRSSVDAKWSMSPLVKVWASGDNPDYGYARYLYFGYEGENTDASISGFLYPKCEGVPCEYLEKQGLFVNFTENVIEL